MAERIDQVQYTKDKDGFATQEVPFFNGPIEFLVVQICEQLKLIPQWKALFSDQIEPYKRMDFSMRALPAMRVYNDTGAKDAESWFIDGDIKIDVLFPAAVRRNDLQQIQDTVTGALLQQFRRPAFFDLMGQKVPGLNELGKKFSWDKSLGFDFEEAMVPLTQITINFRLDLRIWDEYLTETLRTKDSPFDKVLGTLDRIVSTIDGLRDSGDTEVELGIDQKT